MTHKRKQEIVALLKSIETGEEAPTRIVNPDKYIQHNPQTHEGGEGLAALFKRLSKSSPRVNIVRIFSDGDFVFGHTEYDFSSRRIGFEVFRFEHELAVEHWDNIQSRQGPNPSGHSMVDGEINVVDLDKTEVNRALIRSFVDEVLIGGQINRLGEFASEQSYVEHNPRLTDGIESLRNALLLEPESEKVCIKYQHCHRLLAEGNFVLTVCEGFRDEAHTSFYDLYRIANGKIVEHWDTAEKVPPLSEWRNDNGKF